jgi:phage gp36-like protein
MAYATRVDMVDRFTELEISRLEPKVVVGQTQEDVVGKALVDATALADSYIAARYALPLPSTPAALVGAVCDLARAALYTLAPPQEVAARAARAQAWLRNVSSGAAVLIFDPPLTPTETASQSGPSSPYAAPQSAAAGVGVFSDAVLDGMPNMARADSLGVRRSA